MRCLLASMTALLVMLLSLGSASAAGTWSRTFTDDGNQQAMDTVELPDGNLMVVGKFVRPAEKGRGWRLELDAGGAALSQQAYAVRFAPSGNLSTIDAAALSPDGSAFFAGRNIVDFFRIHHAWAAKVDPDGTIAWSTRLFAPEGRFFLFDAVHTSDGGVVAAGSTSRAWSSWPKTGGCCCCAAATKDSTNGSEKYLNRRRYRSAISYSTGVKSPPW